MNAPSLGNSTQPACPIHLCAAGFVEQHAGHQQLPGVIKQLLLCTNIMTERNRLHQAKAPRKTSSGGAEGRLAWHRPSQQLAAGKWQPLGNMRTQRRTAVGTQHALHRPACTVANKESLPPLTEQAKGRDGRLPQAQPRVRLICCCRCRRCALRNSWAGCTGCCHSYGRGFG